MRMKKGMEGKNDDYYKADLTRGERREKKNLFPPILNFSSMKHRNGIFCFTYQDSKIEKYRDIE